MPLISVVTPLFPIAEEPYRGSFIYQTVLALQKYTDVEVCSPISVYPPFLKPRFRYRRVDLSYRPAGVERMRYLEYFAIPVLSRPVNGLVCARALYPHLAKSRPDLILNYWVYPEGNSCVRIARRLNKPVLVGSRGSDLRRIPDAITRALVRWTVRSADGVLTVSEDLRQRAIALGAAPDRVWSIPNGCDRRVFSCQPSAEIRTEAGIGPADRVILFTGALTPPKGVPELLQAFQKLAAGDPLLHLVCIGEGPLHAQILEFAAQNGLSGRIRVPGKLSSAEVARWMNAADVFCLPSHSEGCPNVVVEAIACGCPVVATDVGGIPDLVSPACGILTPPGNADRLAEALRQALAVAWNRQDIARQSRRGWDAVASETWAACQEVMKRRR
jgi:teichuronic acid biosynthesis glycosyltransferase TuaC